MSGPRPRLLAIEDDPRLRGAIVELLAGDGYDVTAVGSAAEARAHVERQASDLVLVDLGLPDLDGVALIAQLAKSHPHLPIVVLTSANARARVLAAIRAGATGYLLKEDLGQRLAGAVAEALAGGMPMSAGAARYVLEQLRGAAPTGCPSPTQREREVLSLLARGLKYGEIANVLGVSINTIRVYVRGAYEKLNASNKAEAVMIAVREGWLEP